jgi:hypothetical protein
MRQRLHEVPPRPHLEERLLHHFLRVVAVADDQVQRAEEPLVLDLEEILERPNQVAVLRWRLRGMRPVRVRSGGIDPRPVARLHVGSHHEASAGTRTSTDPGPPREESSTDDAFMSIECSRAAMC